MQGIDYTALGKYCEAVEKATHHRDRRDLQIRQVGAMISKIAVFQPEPPPHQLFAHTYCAGTMEGYAKLITNEHHQMLIAISEANEHAAAARRPKLRIAIDFEAEYKLGYSAELFEPLAPVLTRS